MRRTPSPLPNAPPSNSVKDDQCAVTVCICTYQRASVVDAVESVAHQVIPERTAVEILVIDNDYEPTARDAILNRYSESEIPVHYRHIPGQNISIARNEAVETVKTPWLAFIDDDEHASPRWLSRILSARHGANVVFGPCEAVYGSQSPRWIKAGDYHSNRIPAETKLPTTGYTSNVLVDMEFVRRCGLRFDPLLGRTGGEDTIFFYRIFKMGGILKYAPEAIVYEHVVASRISARWIAIRRFRAGQVYAKMFYDYDRTKYWRAVLTAPAKIIACLCGCLGLAFYPSRVMWWLMRGIFHLGVLSFALGSNIFEEYSSPTKACK